MSGFCPLAWFFQALDGAAGRGRRVYHGARHDLLGDADADCHRHLVVHCDYLNRLCRVAAIAGECLCRSDLGALPNGGGVLGAQVGVSTPHPVWICGFGWRCFVLGVASWPLICWFIPCCRVD